MMEIVIDEHDLESVDHVPVFYWRLFSSAKFTLFVCVLNNKTKEGRQHDANY
jgi:hypothetical protein